MVGERWRVFPVGLGVLVILLTGICALGRDTEEQLLGRIQGEQNPIKKAKYEIKLASLILAEVKDAYAQGHPEEGEKLVARLGETLKTSWKLLQDSGRKASKQPDGFRELEISLRETVRSLQDLERDVSYFDRAPLENAGQQLDQMRNEVLQALFPEDYPRSHKASPPPQTNPSPGKFQEVR